MGYANKVMKIMKKLKILIFCIALTGILGCEKNESEDFKNLEVDRYVSLLKNGSYSSRELPEFTYKDIPALLEYRDETQMIKNFPKNGISSLAIQECSLGMYVLWTIESIRAVAIESKYLNGRFPSQNPIIVKRGQTFEIVKTIEVQTIISKCYYSWWERNKNREFNHFKKIDPLSDTEYMWH